MPYKVNFSVSTISNVGRGPNEKTYLYFAIQFRVTETGVNVVENYWLCGI
jgi:hypothetical protein